MDPKRVRLSGTVDVVRFDDSGGTTRYTKPLQPPRRRKHCGSRQYRGCPPSYDNVEDEIHKRRMQAIEVRTILKEEYLEQKQASGNPQAFPSFSVWKGLIVPGDGRLTDDERQASLEEYCHEQSL